MHKQNQVEKRRSRTRWHSASKVRRGRRRYLRKERSRIKWSFFIGISFVKMGAPPKLPGTTSFALTRSKNDQSEIKAMETKVMLENRMPPLKNLDEVEQNESHCGRRITYAFPRKRTPVPTKPFKSYIKFISYEADLKKVAPIP